MGTKVYTVNLTMSRRKSEANIEAKLQEPKQAIVPKQEHVLSEDTLFRICAPCGVMTARQFIVTPG